MTCTRCTGTASSPCNRRRYDDATAFGDFAEHRDSGAPGPKEQAASHVSVADDRLRLVFTRCHPALPPEACTALTLHEVWGLSTEEIARLVFNEGYAASSGESLPPAPPRPRSARTAFPHGKMLP